MGKRLKRFLGSVSPWVVIGMSLILVVVVLVLAAMNYNREKEGMARVLGEKGSALIRAVEAGARTGMMGQLGQAPNLEVLLREIASQPDILYIAVVDPSGRILAHSDASKIGESFATREGMAGLNISGKVQWRVVPGPDGTKAFETYKLFLPTRRRGNGTGTGRQQRGMMGEHGMEHGHRMRESKGRDKYWCCPTWMQGLDEPAILDPDRRPAIFLGMDEAPFERAAAQDIALNLAMSGILLLVGLVGVVSLFWMQRHAQSRRLLQDSKALNAEMVANIPEGLVVCDPDGRITYVNDIALDMLGHDTEQVTQLVGRGADTLLPEELWSLREQLDRDGGVVQREMDLRLGKARKTPLAVVVTDIITEDGAHVGQLFMVRDLSQVRDLQEEIRKADRMAAIGHLAAGVAHEVRNPLSSIKGYATYFGSLFEKDSENRKAAEVMTSEVDRLNRVISELLEMARPTDVKPRDTDVATLLESSTRLVRQEAQGSGISISLDTAEDVGSFPLDPDRLSQALINLYVNAIQAMPDGGSLDIRARLQDDALQLLVRDTGPGLPEGDPARIFDPYFTTKATGTGLGLAIVSKIVAAHSGEIRVEHTGPEGTTFSILIPRGNSGDNQQ